MSEALPRVLIVDDTPSNLQTLGGILRETGLYRISLASSGAEALALCERIRPDLILLDVMMPEMSGFEVIGKFQENPMLIDVPVLFVTARTDAADVVHGLQLGGADYITKPAVPEVLLARVRNQVLAGQAMALLREKNRLLAERGHIAMHALAQRRLSAIGEMVVNTLRDISQPLTYIEGAMYMLVQQYGECLGPEGGAQIKEVRKQINRIALALGHLDGFGRVSADGTSSLVNWADALQDATALLLGEMKQASVALDIQADAECGNVLGVHGEFVRAVVHLLQNAIDALGSTELSARRVYLSVSREGNDVVVRCNDNGEGMGEAVSAQAVEPFFTTRDAVRHAGLGLSLVQDAVQRWDGAMTIDSTPGQGTTITLRFPVAEREAD